MAPEPDPPDPTDDAAASDQGGFSGLDTQVQEKLGQMFQSFCEEMVKQPVPDKFMVLLAQLEAKERGLK